MGLPVEIEQINLEQINRFQTGRKDIIPLGEIPMFAYRMKGTMNNSVANRTKMMEVFGHPQRPLLFMDRSFENSWQVYVMQRVGQMSMPEQIGGNNGVRDYSVAYETIL